MPTQDPREAFAPEMVRVLEYLEDAMARGLSNEARAAAARDMMDELGTDAERLYIRGWCAAELAGRALLGWYRADRKGAKAFVAECLSQARDWT